MTGSAPVSSPRIERDKTSIAASLIVWAFFILIATKSLEFFAEVHDSPIRPFEIYTFLIGVSWGVIFVHARTIGLGTIWQNITRIELVLFALVAALVVFIAASFGGHQDYAMRIRVWPLANFAMATAMFYFGRYMKLGSVIRAAAFGALVVQLAGIFLDLWIPGLFAQWAARPAGLPQNSNNGALLASFFLAFLFPIGLNARSDRKLLYAIVVAGPLILVSLSRSGLLFYFGSLAAYLGILLLGRATLPSVATCFRFALIYFVVLLLSATFSPTLREPVTVAIWHARLGFSPIDLTGEAIDGLSKKVASFAKAIQTKVVSSEKIEAQKNATPQDVLDEAIDISDNTVSVRWRALKFFLKTARAHPWLGMGTGYGYLFQVGPHNTFVSLAAEQGILALIAYAIALLLLLILAILQASPLLLVVLGVGVVDSVLSHTILVEPEFLILVFAALGFLTPKSASLPSPVAKTSACFSRKASLG